MSQEPIIIASGKRIILRDKLLSDLDFFVFVETRGQWRDYSDIHRISLDTWSFNPRMIRVAQKLGFVYEGAQREMQQWQGEWLDLLHFGMLRSEWDTFQHP